MSVSLGVFASLAALAGCDAPQEGGGDAGPPSPLATEVVSAPGATGEGFGDPTRAVNGVRGAGPDMGSLDVYSLNHADRAELVLGWHGARVLDGPGVDLVVFENPFRVSGGDLVFMDPVVVSLSRDGETWVAFPHRYLAEEPLRHSMDPADWQGFAGVTPVLWSDDAPGVDPFDPAIAGGDGFDLATLPGEEGEAIRAEGARYVRLQNAALLINPETGERYPRSPASDGPDIDGVIARYLMP